MDYILEASGLCKQYRHFKALNDFSMHIPRGSIYGFVGKNGAGKTTMIRLICGLQAPTQGSFTLYGTKNTDKAIAKARRRVGAIVETPSIYMDMNAVDNLKTQYRILGIPSFDTIPGLLRLVGLEHTGRKKARHFSLGMRQRLGIAIALAGSPDFLILDEPANGLDPQGIVEMRELILKLNRERQITVLISSHILDELARLATHYGFIDRGHMIQEISAEELNSVCRKCMRVTVSDITAMTRALEATGTDYQILSDNEADIFSQSSVTQLVNDLLREHCEVLALSQRDESLESYYMNLVGNYASEAPGGHQKPDTAPGGRPKHQAAPDRQQRSGREE